MPTILDIPPEVLRDRHRLSPQQINSLHNKTVVEEDIEDKAADIGRVAEFVRIGDILTKAGINFMTLKGPLLSYKLYGDAHYRYFRDIDLWVDTSDVSIVSKILIENGYQAYGRNWPDNNKKLSRMLRFYHDISLFNPDKNILIELHWRLMSRSYIDEQTVAETVDQNIAELAFAGRSFRTMNNEMELLYLILHGGAHRWGRLKWLLDVYDYINSQTINRDKFLELSNDFNAGRLVALCNHMLSEYFDQDAKIPCNGNAPGFMIRFSKRSIQNKTYNPPHLGDIFKRQLYYLMMYPGLNYKIKLLGDILFNSGIFKRAKKIYAQQ